MRVRTVLIGPRTRALTKVMVGPRRLGPLGSSAGQGRVSLGSRIRGAEEGATSRQGVEASGLDTPTVKMDQKRWFSSHIPVTSKESPRSRGIRARGVGNAVVRTTIKEPLGKRRLVRVMSQG